MGGGVDKNDDQYSKNSKSNQNGQDNMMRYTLGFLKKSEQEKKLREE
jgi:hypothetical protein